MTNRISAAAIVKVWFKLAGMVDPFSNYRYAARDDDKVDYEFEDKSPLEEEESRKKREKRDVKKEQEVVERGSDFNEMLKNLGRGAASILYQEKKEDGSKAFPDCPNPGSSASGVFIDWGRRLYNQAKRQFGDPEVAVQEKFLYYLKSGHKFSKGDKGAKTADQAINYMGMDIKKGAQTMSRRQNKLRQKTKLEKAMEGYAKLLWKKNAIADGVAGVKWSARDTSSMERFQKEIEAEGIDISTIQPQKTVSDSDRAKSIDEAFGTVGEGGDAPSGGEGNMPTPRTDIFDPSHTTPLKHTLSPEEGAEEYEVESEIMPLLSEFYRRLPDDQKILWDIILTEEEGGFFEPGTIGDQHNMHQQVLFKEKCTELGRSDILAKFSNKNYFNDKVRKPLLNGLRAYINDEIGPDAWDLLYDRWSGGEDFKTVNAPQEQKEIRNHEFLKGQEESKLKRALEEYEKSGSDKSFKDIKRIEEKLKDWEEVGKLRWLKKQRKLTATERIRLKELEMKEHVRDHSDGIAPIPYDLGLEVEYAEMKYKEQQAGGIENMSDEDLDRYDEIEAILRAPPYGFNDEVLASIKPRSPGSTRVSALIAARIAGLSKKRLSLAELDW
jgi:hypothetical protein